MSRHSGVQPDVVTQGGGGRVYSGGNVDNGHVRTYGGTDGALAASGVGETMTFTKSSSDNWWTGSGTPKEIDGSEKWWLSGVDVTISIPPAVGFSGAGSAITWNPSEVANTTAEQLNWPGAIKESALLVYDGYYTNQADMLIGSTWWHVQGS